MLKTRFTELVGVDAEADPELLRQRDVLFERRVRQGQLAHREACRPRHVAFFHVDHEAADAMERPIDGQPFRSHAVAESETRD